MQSGRYRAALGPGRGRGRAGVAAGGGRAAAGAKYGEMGEQESAEQAAGRLTQRRWQGRR